MLTRRQLLTFFDATATANDDQSHTIVCVFLRGAADTLNIVVPYDDDEYYRARPSLAIPPPSSAAATAIRLDDRFALHPKMAPLVPAFNEGRLAIVHAVGSDNSSGSHFEAQDQMEHGAGATSSVTGGWIGRYVMACPGAARAPLAAVAIATTLPESMRGASTACVIESLDDVGLHVVDDARDVATRALEMLYRDDPGVLARPGTEALRLLSRVETLKSSPYRPKTGAEYPSDPFGAGLREVARLVKAGVGLRVACVDLGGWDTHFVQGAIEGLQATLIETLAGALAAFDVDLAAYREHVTVVVMTEFGRRIYENSSSGTDHGRGFAMFALGGRVRGGRTIGEWPGLDQEEGPIGPGGVRVLVDYRSVLAEVLTGAAGLHDTSAVFPDFHPQPLGIVA
jgi:uncharacterized protein (DUF1501 family)